MLGFGQGPTRLYGLSRPLRNRLGGTSRQLANYYWLLGQDVTLEPSVVDSLVPYSSRRPFSIKSCSAGLLRPLRNQLGEPSRQLANCYWLLGQDVTFGAECGQLAGSLELQTIIAGRS